MTTPEFPPKRRYDSPPVRHPWLILPETHTASGDVINSVPETAQGLNQGSNEIEDGQEMKDILNSLQILETPITLAPKEFPWRGEPNKNAPKPPINP